MNKIIQTISNQTGLSCEQITMVLYTYFAETLQECLTNPMKGCRTIYGILYVDDNNNLQIDSGGQMQERGVFSKSDLANLVSLLKEGPNVPVVY